MGILPMNHHGRDARATQNACPDGIHYSFPTKKCATNCATFLAQHVQHVLYVQVLLDLAKCMKIGKFLISSGLRKRTSLGS